MGHYENEITIFVKGGLIQDVKGVPDNTKIVIVDYDIDGIEDENLEKVGDQYAHVIEL